MESTGLTDLLVAIAEHDPSDPLNQYVVHLFEDDPELAIPYGAELSPGERMPVPSLPPFLEVLVSSDEPNRWDLTVASGSTCTPALAGKLDEYLKVRDVSAPDFADLARHMRDFDAPYEKYEGGSTSFEFGARGRAAFALAIWLEALVTPEPVYSRAGRGLSSIETMQVFTY